MTRKSGPIGRVRNRRNAPPNAPGGAVAAIALLKLIDVTAPAGMTISLSVVNPENGILSAVGETSGGTETIVAPKAYYSINSGALYQVGAATQNNDVITLESDGINEWVIGDSIEITIAAFGLPIIGAGNIVSGPMYGYLTSN